MRVPAALYAHALHRPHPVPADPLSRRPQPVAQTQCWRDAPCQLPRASQGLADQIQCLAARQRLHQQRRCWGRVWSPSALRPAAGQHPAAQAAAVPCRTNEHACAG
ncbi:hypothetical protein DUNSADRAFT_4673 [Dunaliella salina]|uniref:Uncharacterized protein n=1 Tax=Dunaliella salina TaxID=3046 RepID=A0ABQ7GRI9_DUNSA|nr:hypothetical protein DUNSADRAFT_4673 [Dunaliella salina]|eukprot:KAF5837218.1 hypothetical protein DUNSADRAFT_4673 [Dunaliella salina]